MPAAVLVDTGPLVGMFDPSDRAHEKCMTELARLEGRKLVTSLAVITEAMYLLDFSKHAQQALLAFIAAGAVEISEFSALAVGRARTLMAKYHDLPMDFADASLIVLAETLETLDIFTLDRKDFTIYRVGRRKPRLFPTS